jgi:hypothetical protein
LRIFKHMGSFSFFLEFEVDGGGLICQALGA